MQKNNIRNFSIIAHIDHGKSTLADRMLEITQTIEGRKMQDQVLDSMELERERGITIKMQPVRMNHAVEGEEYILNLIDTPGHIDFSYEVSRALKAVEGSILLVDATQGVQAQTFTTLDMAQKQGLTLIPVVTKVDSPLARPDEVKLEIAEVLDVDPDSILEVSGKTGQGVRELLDHVARTVPAPQASEDEGLRALVFDFEYSNHKGVIVYVRVFNGEVKKGDQLSFVASKKKFHAIEIGTFSPNPKPADKLKAGEIGYIVTGVKEAGIASVGDTITLQKQQLSGLPGYQQPVPVVWASIYPESQDDFDALRASLLFCIIFTTEIPKRMRTRRRINKKIGEYHHLVVFFVLKPIMLQSYHYVRKTIKKSIQNINVYRYRFGGYRYGAYLRTHLLV
jgi:GTP-binding protein LepA